ncbi:MAG: signal peptidase I [Bacteroidales bacterium]|nr:signal peptidase I [Bacteroidales bacterium]
MKYHLFKKIANKAIFVAVCAVAAYFLLRIFVVDSFIVKGNSMEPSFHEGRRVYVNKLLMGARIYTDFDFTKSELHSFRMPGMRRVEVGDAVIINYPFARCEDTINFKINYVYLKRCYGRPGDSVSIVKGHYCNSRVAGAIGPQYYQDLLGQESDSSLVECGVALKAYHLNNNLCWTILNFGPLYVPKKGDKIVLNKNNALSYRKLIQYETGYMPDIVGEKAYIEGIEITHYTFAGNWYFLGGDNVLNSQDSRYIGLMPEEYIIGIVNERKNFKTK